MYVVALKDKRSGEWRVPSHFVNQCGQLHGVTFEEASALLGCAYDREAAQGCAKVITVTQADELRSFDLVA